MVESTITSTSPARSPAAFATTGRTATLKTKARATGPTPAMGALQNGQRNASIREQDSRGRSSDAGGQGDGAREEQERGQRARRSIGTQRGAIEAEERGRDLTMRPSQGARQQVKVEIERHRRLCRWRLGSAGARA